VGGLAQLLWFYDLFAPISRDQFGAERNRLLTTLLPLCPGLRCVSAQQDALPFPAGCSGRAGTFIRWVALRTVGARMHASRSSEALQLVSIETGGAAMTTARLTSIIAQTLIAAAFAVVVFGTVQAVASKVSAASYSAPTYSSAL
jgi:hypothetical protein